MSIHSGRFAFAAVGLMAVFVAGPLFADEEADARDALADAKGRIADTHRMALKGAEAVAAHDRAHATLAAAEAHLKVENERHAAHAARTAVALADLAMAKSELAKLDGERAALPEAEPLDDKAPRLALSADPLQPVPGSEQSDMAVYR